MATNDTDTETTRLAVGLDVSAERVTCSVTDGSKIQTLPLGDEAPPSTTIETTVDGVDLVPSTAPDASDHSIDVFPRYDPSVPDRTGRDRARFTQEATRLFESVRRALDDDLREVAGRLLDVAPERVNVDALLADAAVSVPGAYDDRDREDVVRALQAAGIDTETVVRAPLGLAATHFFSVNEPTLVAAVDVGPHWCDMALIDVDPDARTYAVRSRVSVPGLGRQAMDRALAEWAFEAEAADRNVGIDYTPAAFERVRAAAHETLDALAESEETTLAVPDLDDVSLEVGRPPIDVEQSVDVATVWDVFDDLTTRLSDGFGRLLGDAETGTDADAIDAVVVGGSGTVPPVVERAVEGYFEQPVIRPQPGDPADLPALGAAVLGYQHGDGTPIAAETVAREIGVLVPTAAGDLAFEQVVPAGAPVDEPRRVRLTTTEANQTRGALTLVSRHQLTEETRELGSYKVTGIPMRPAGEMPFEIAVTPRDFGVEVDPSIPPAAVDGQIDASLDVKPVPTGEEVDQWFVPAGTDPSDVEVPADRAAETRTALVDPLAESFEDIAPESVLEALLDVRYNIWISANGEEPMDPADLQKLLTQFDSTLRRIRVEMIDPDAGEQKDRSRHRVWQTEPSERPDGEILNVRKPGYEIDGHVETPAEVVVSKGEPEEPSEPEEPEESTEGTADAAESGSGSDGETPTETEADGTADAGGDEKPAGDGEPTEADADGDAGADGDADASPESGPDPGPAGESQSAGTDGEDGAADDTGAAGESAGADATGSESATAAGEATDGRTEGADEEVERRVIHPPDEEPTDGEADGSEAAGTDERTADDPTDEGPDGK